MKYVEKINLFMKKRNNILEKKYNFYGYYTENDEKDILSWDEKTAKKIWNNLFEASIKGNWFCPFCIYNDIERFSCSKCSYGKRHGKCSFKAGNTWGELKKGDYISDMYYSGIYEEIINEIEKQDKEND